MAPKPYSYRLRPLNPKLSSESRYRAWGLRAGVRAEGLGLQAFDLGFTHRLHSSSFVGITLLDSKYEIQTGTTMEHLGKAVSDFKALSFGASEKGLEML